MAQQRLNELKSQRRMLEAQRPRRLRGRRGQRDADRPRPGEKLYGTLRGRLEKLGKFQTRNTLDRTHPRSLLGGGLRVGRVQPFGGASRRADPFDANDTVRADPFLEETTPRAGARYDDDVFLDGSPSGRGW